MSLSFSHPDCVCLFIEDKVVNTIFNYHYEGHGRGHHLLHVKVQLFLILPFEGASLKKSILGAAFYLNFDTSYFKGTLFILLFQFTLCQHFEYYHSCYSKRTGSSPTSNLYLFVCFGGRGKEHKIKDCLLSCLQAPHLKEQQYCEVGNLHLLQIMFYFMWL